MIPRNPPPAPHLHAAHLPQAQRVPQIHSQGDTEISYTAYSPSPSSLSNHRYKWSRIRDWRSHHPAPPARHLGSIGSHHPSVGVGSAYWSDSGTGLDEGQTDIGTIPTTVRVDRELRDSTIVPDKRDRLDPIRAMGSHQSRKAAQEDANGGPSELPYRQNSQRRDVRPAPEKVGVKHATRPINASQRYDPTCVRTAQIDLAQSGLASSQAPQRPPLVHSSARSKPTPHLARPPATQATLPPTRILPAGSPIVTSPESDKRNGGGGGKNSPFAIREAYLNSALTLPLDMLSQTEKAAPPEVPQLKSAKSQSSISSGLTTGRLGSLLGNSRGPSPNGAMKRVVSDSKAMRPTHASGGVRANGDDVKPPVVQRDGRMERSAEMRPDIGQAGSDSSSRTERPFAPIQGAAPRTLASAAHLSRSATVPINAKTPSAQPAATRSKEVSALGLDLGSLATTVIRPSNQLLPLEPVATVALQPAPHRQVIALRRPALTPLNSTDNLAKTLALGRRSRDPSMTDLRTRFEPATYPLPDSKSSASATKSQTSGEGKVSTMTSIRAKDRAEETVASQPLGRQSKSKQTKAKMTPTEEPVLGISSIGPQPTISAEDVVPLHHQVSPAVLSVPPAVHAPPLAPAPPPIIAALNVDHLALPQPPDEPVLPHAVPPPTPGPASPDLERSYPSQVRDSSLSSSAPQQTTATHQSPKVHRVDRIREDDDRVSFEVPNGARGRLRVSLAWFRDRGRARADGGHARTPSETPPPPLPPKPERLPSGLRRRPIMPDPISPTETPDHTSPLRRRPSPRPVYHDAVPQRHSPIRSPVDLDQPRIYPPFDPYRPHAAVPAYQPAPAPAAPPIPPFQMTHAFAYPQPHPWASHPQLVPPHVQIQPPPAQGSRRPPSVESFDPPSGGGTPPAPPRVLPGMMGPMGMQSNMLHPFPTQSLHPAGTGMPQSPTHAGFGPQSAYGRSQQPLWKRMFNGRQNEWQNGGVGYGMDDDNAGVNAYGRQTWGAFGNDKIGKWMRGITPGRAPPPRSQAPGTVAGVLFGDRGGGVGTGKREYNLTQPFFRRADRGGYVNGNADIYEQGQRRDRSPYPNGYANHLDSLDRQPRRTGSGFLPRQGGMIDRMFTPGRPRRQQQQQQQLRQGGMWSTNQPRQTTAYDARDRYKEARRREKIDRRNARAQAQAQARYLSQSQGQQQGYRGGRSQGMVRDWVGRLSDPVRMTNGYGPQPQTQGMGRKLSRGGGGVGGRWKDRLPRENRVGQRGFSGGRANAQGGGLGLMSIGRAFGR